MIRSCFKMIMVGNRFRPITHIPIKLLLCSRSFSTVEHISSNPSPDTTETAESTVKAPLKFTRNLRRHKLNKDKIPREPKTIHDALKLVKELAWANFDETIDIAINLGLDPRKPNQSIKGVARLPHGTGKVVRVCVFASGADAEAARIAGAEIVGAEDLLAKIQAGFLGFDTVIATPELMSVVGKLGRVLGPRGMMSNPKMGTVTKDISRAVKAAKAGAVQFKVEKKGIVHAAIGKVSFSQEALLDNVRAMMLAIIEAKPEGLKGKYILNASVSSTMGPGIRLEVSSVDPSNNKFMVQF